MTFANGFGIGAQIGSALAPMASSAIGSIFSNHASGKAFGRQLYAMQEQARLNYAYGIKSLKNSPSAQRFGLEKAGYNPMLAVGNATSGANSGWASPNGVNMDEYSGNIQAQASNAQGFLNAQALQDQTASNVALNATQQSLNEAQAQKQRSETTAQDIHNQYLNSREQKELGKIDAETGKLNADTAYTNELKDNIKARLELDKYIADLQSFTGITTAGIGASASNYNAVLNNEANRYATDKNYDIQHERNIIASLGTLALPIGGLVSKGAKLFKAGNVARNIKKHKQSYDYYKNMAKTIVH